MLDTYRQVVTPEGVALHLRAAGPVPRALAYLLDLLARGAIYVALVQLLAIPFGQAGGALVMLASFALTWFYPVLFEVLMQGRTPGKWALGLRVVAADGAPVGWMAAFARNLLRVVDALPLFYAVGLATSLIDPWGRRLGDMVARTLVVHAPRQALLHEAVAAPAMAPDQLLLAHEQAAVVAFAERGPGLTAARQAELADLAEPLVHARGQAAVARLYGIANWLLGRR
ncbi:RDD family protein [Lysobacter enzymogenes]|uniref:RDD family protein n=1 Tax=Lysobacter enzymogenes TaxID=69 RepID=A0A3N2RLQ9_LYSEN|nr:RDD family protein [Lysobacter enzymogenes]ROU08349.1 RDD family protein [Lysobacter enzymogenes]